VARGRAPRGEADRHWLAAEDLVEPEPIEGETPGEPKKRSPSITETAGIGLTSNRFLEAIVRDQWLSQSLKLDSSLAGDSSALLP
jgi:hypothetical protein